MSRFDVNLTQRTLFDALLDAAHKYGTNKPILEDQERNPLSYTDLIRASFALGRKIASITERGEQVSGEVPFDLCFGQCVQPACVEAVDPFLEGVVCVSAMSFLDMAAA